MSQTEPFSYRGWVLTHEAGQWSGRREGEQVREATYIGLLQTLAEMPLLLHHRLDVLARVTDVPSAPEPTNVLPFSPRPARPPSWTVTPIASPPTGTGRQPKLPRQVCGTCGGYCKHVDRMAERCPHCQGPLPKWNPARCW